MSQQINLFSSVLLPPRPVVTAARLALLLALLVIATLGYRSYLIRELAQAESDLAKANARLTGLQAQASKFGRLAAQGKDKALEESIAKTQAELAVRETLLDRLKGGGLGNAKGFSNYMAALARQRAEGLWITGLVVSGGGADFEIQGGLTRPETLPEYVRRLSREDVWRGRQIDELRMASKELELRADRTAAPAVQAGAAQSAIERPAAAVKAPAKLRYVEFSIVSGSARSGTGG